MHVAALGACEVREDRRTVCSCDWHRMAWRLHDHDHSVWQHRLMAQAWHRHGMAQVWHGTGMAQAWHGTGMAQVWQHRPMPGLTSILNL